MKKYKTDTLTSQAHEAAVAYGQIGSPDFFYDFKKLIKDKIKLVMQIRKGLSVTFYRDLLRYLPLDEERWAEILGVSTKSLRRYQEDGYTFKPIHSEKLIEMTEVTLYGMEAFGSIDKFNRWLHTPSPIFEGMAPVELLADSYGKELVLNELIRIDHGIFA